MATTSPCPNTDAHLPHRGWGGERPSVCLGIAASNTCAAMFPNDYLAFACDLPVGHTDPGMHHDPNGASWSANGPTAYRPLIGQPDGITDDSRDLPDPMRAAERVRAYIAATGDGLYDTQDGRPLYGRDLEALTRAVGSVVREDVPR